MKLVFKMYISFNQIISNIRKGYYRYIGSGSSRQVFDMENGYVIKIAKNQAGIAQNMFEYKIASNDHSNLFAKVIQASKNFIFLIMQKANNINDLSYVLKYFNVSNEAELTNTKELQRIKKNYNLLLHDLYKKSSWGTINGRPVIIDYGFTREVRNRYYS